MTDSRQDRGFPALDSRDGPANPLSPSDSAALVERAVGRVLTKAKGPRILRLRWLGLAAIAVAASAGAATWVAQQRTTANVAASAPPVPASALAPGRVYQPHPVAETPVAEPQPSAPRRPASPAATAPSTERTKVTAADGIGAANELRRAGRWQEAEAMYREVATNFPSAPEAYVASMAAAALRLEHLGDPAGALGLYRSLARGGSLGVEAMFGIARCHRALGEAAAEKAALEAVVSAYPTSLQADRARQRLGEINLPSTGQ
jgi:tetratricopeptide (TPR) repeat protein